MPTVGMASGGGLDCEVISMFTALTTCRCKLILCRFALPTARRVENSAKCHSVSYNIRRCVMAEGS